MLVHKYQILTKYHLQVEVVPRTTLPSLTRSIRCTIPHRPKHRKPSLTRRARSCRFKAVGCDNTALRHACHPPDLAREDIATILGQTSSDTFMYDIFLSICCTRHISTYVPLCSTHYVSLCTRLISTYVAIFDMSVTGIHLYVR